MKLRQFGGMTLVPLLSRLVLALAFTTVGFNKIFSKAEFTAAEARILEELNVPVEPVEPVEDVPAAASAASAATSGRSGSVMLVAWQDAPDADVELDPADGAAPAQTPSDEPAPGAAQPGVTDDDDARYRATSMHKITLLVHGAEWPQPKLMATVAALTEFLGGLLILLGFLTRVWALGLAVAMGVAFYLVSMNIYQVHTTNPFVFAQDIGRFNTASNQLALFVLSVGLLFTGAGPLSVDRLLFGRQKRSIEDALAEPEPSLDIASPPPPPPAPPPAPPAPASIPMAPAPAPAVAPAPAPALAPPEPTLPLSPPDDPSPAGMPAEDGDELPIGETRPL